MKQYKRDKRSPVPSSPQVSKVMSSIRSKNTKPEVHLRKFLWAKGLKGYRVHYKLPGRPDIVFPSEKVAIFVHGCFWHRCPYCNLQLPKHNTSFWQNKFNKNVERDRNKSNELMVLGWQVLTIWECELNTKVEDKVNEIRKAIHKVE
ncbi:MAG: very short patch repair endonuclease [Sphingobacteriales bacterium]|nr:MAG: very short patch repair endonuclease [Sphingobacteriales bacterium]